MIHLNFPSNPLISHRHTRKSPNNHENPRTIIASFHGQKFMLKSKSGCSKFKIISVSNKVIYLYIQQVIYLINKCIFFYIQQDCL